MGEQRNACRPLVGNLEDKEPFGRLNENEKIIRQIVTDEADSRFSELCEGAEKAVGIVQSMFWKKLTSNVYHTVCSFCCFSSGALYFQSPYYTAAVVEYGAVGNVSIDDPQQVLMMNANNYVHYVTQAARSVSTS